MLKIKQREQGRFVFNETLPQPVSASVVEVYIGGDHPGVPQ